MFNLGVIPISKTYLDSSTPLHSSDIKLDGCKLITLDHPSYSRKDGIC